MTPLKSSNLAGASYDDSTRELTVKFQNGSTWVYADVPRHVFDDLLTAPSAGRYFAGSIRGRFTGRRP